MDNHGPLEERVTRLEAAVFGPTISLWRRVLRVTFGVWLGAVTLYGSLTLLNDLLGLHESIEFVVGTVILAGFLASFFYMVLKFDQFSKRHPDWAAVVTGAALGGLAGSIGLLYFQAALLNEWEVVLSWRHEAKTASLQSSSQEKRQHQEIPVSDT